MKIIFKYFSEGVIEHVFSRSGHVGLKCSLPKDYNDPFELFLGIDLDQGSELLATYSEVVQDIPHLLTTCFSTSPLVAPMWAHYGNNHKGFVLGFSVEQMEKKFKEIMVRDIAYRERPSEDLIKFSQMAAYRKKPRDAMALRRAVYYHAYFSKYSEWSYEKEARAINLEEYVEEVAGNMILYMPAGCIQMISSGANASAGSRETLETRARELDADYYDAKIGRSYPTPYLVSLNKEPRVLIDGIISPPLGECRQCAEPMKDPGDVCPWCAIDEDHRLAAAQGNPFRILDRHNLLEEYFNRYPVRPRKPYG